MARLASSLFRRAGHATAGAMGALGDAAATFAPGRAFPRLGAHAYAAAVALLGVAAAGAQTYPTRHITLVVPQAAGGPADINGRLIASPLGEVLGTRVIVDNRTGAGTSVGTASVARSGPDGYTLLIADITFVVGPHVLASSGYDPQSDFTPIALLTRSDMFLVVNPSVAAGTMSDLIALAKKEPTGFQYAAAGLGTPPHLAGLAFAKATGVSMSPVTYRGAGPAVADVIAGHLPAMFLGVSAAGPQIKSGGLRALAVTGPNRLPDFPDVPTFLEGGIRLAGIDAGTWFGIVAPAGTPKSVVGKLNAAINQALRSPKVHQGLEAADLAVVGGSPQQFRTFLDAQSQSWRETLATYRTGEK